MTRADEALKHLLEGNERFAFGNMQHPSLSSERRMETLNGQHPFAVVLGCSDSRVPPELIFDQGLGDLFVVRTAGHVLDRVALESIEYAVSHLGSPLVVVLAHSSCGAVGEAVAHREAPPSEAGRLVEKILPAVEQAAPLHGDIVNNAARIHAQRTARELALSSADMKAVPAFYDLGTGLVEVLAHGGG